MKLLAYLLPVDRKVWSYHLLIRVALAKAVASAVTTYA